MVQRPHYLRETLMVSIKAFIQDLDILEGESIRQDCPFCRGQNTFSVSKVEGVVKYNLSLIHI